MMARFETTNGAPVDTQNDISLAVLNVICAMVFSSRYDLEDPEFYDIIELNSKISRLFSTGQSLQLFPWLKYLPTKLMSEIKEWTSFLQGLSLQDENPGAQGDILRRQKRDLTDSVFKVTKDAEAQGLEVKKLSTEEHMILAQVDIFQAGLDTTATTICYRSSPTLSTTRTYKRKFSKRSITSLVRIGCRHFKTKAIYRTSEPW